MDTVTHKRHRLWALGVARGPRKLLAIAEKLNTVLGWRPHRFSGRCYIHLGMCPSR